VIDLNVGGFGGNDVVGLIERWQPEKWYRSEKKFQEDLANYLRNNVGSNQGFGMSSGEKPAVRTETRNNKADIRVGKNTAIEMKRKLESTSKLDRCVRQVERYSESFGQVIVVVCGASDNMWEELRESINDKFGQPSMMGNQTQVTPIRKEKSNRKSSKKKKSKKKRNKKQGGLLGGQSGNNPFKM